MSKKDYVRIAKSLAQTRPRNSYDSTSRHARREYEQWLMDRGRIASAFAEDNPRFNRSIFIAACEA